MMEHPNVIILAGPNGAGKSTISRTLLAQKYGVCHYVNADAIARGLSAFHYDIMAIKAAKVMLEHLHELADDRVNFAFETTLGTKSFAPWIAELRKTGYVFHLVFVWVPSADVSIQRVQDRVKLGGHFVPEDTIRRRYQRGLKNFFTLYRPIADMWRMIDNSQLGAAHVIAEMSNTIEKINNPQLWRSIQLGVDA
jgi:predicted ABC-type ATPase